MHLKLYEKIFGFLALSLMGFSAEGAVVKTQLSGLENGDNAVISISSESFVASITATENGLFEFQDVTPGTHSVKVETTGYNLPATQHVRVNDDGSVEPMTGIKLVITKMDEDPNNWHHVWEADGSIGGYTTSSHVNTPPEIEFLGKRIVPSDVPSMAILKENYNLILVDDDMQWSQEYAYRLLETLKTLPRNYQGMVPSKFILTNDRLNDDLNIEKEDGGNIVRISQDAFAYANPFLVNLDGVRGRFFSKRLHHALTKFVTDFGNDKEAVDNILSQRFGVSINIPDYKELTASTTAEDENYFQEFLPSEVVAIINMFEELPEGFHVTPNLKYLVRRLNGHPHPIYPGAAAVSWCQENGYIEFMVSDAGSAFSGNNEQFDTQRLILHEKTHFLWAFMFSDEIKNDWTEVGGWYPDPNAGGGWSTTQTTEFVSPYAHAHNPNEDMAESVAYYLKDPEKLMSVAPDKYEFIRDRIMHGTRYISSIPDHLTFEVLNLFPDYDYPGKIKRVDITVEGAPEDEKKIIMEIELNHEEGYQDNASSAIVRISSPTFSDQFDDKYSQFDDIWMLPVDADGYILRGETTINQHSKSGYWTCGDIVVYDNVGNARYEGRNDCVSNVFINNPLEDLESPEYESGSLDYELTDGIEEGHPVQFLKIKYKVRDNVGISSTFARVDNDYEGWSKGGTGLTDTYGTYNAETGEAEITYTIREFLPSANYFVSFISTYDDARTEKTIYFSEAEEHEKVKKIFITTPNPDYEGAEIDLNRIMVFAEPTHPAAPDGETKVSVIFYAKDNISGPGALRYEFRDPQGLMHGDWFYHEDLNTNYFNGDPTVWKRYEINHILPRGSAPGIWGLSMMSISDKAGNVRTYNFVETLIFEPDDSEDGWELFAEIEDKSLIFGINSDETTPYGFKWRVIHEETGKEVNGVYNAMNTRSVAQAVADVSDMPAGNLILIVQVLDEESNVVSVKSRRVGYVGDPILVENISISSEMSSLKKGRQSQLMATILPETATDKTISWTSSDENIATIDEDGNVTAINAGNVTFIATASDGSGVTASFDMEIMAPIKGDSNDNDEVTITDAVNTANYAVGNEVAIFCEEAADVNEDGKITLADASGTVTVLLNQPVETVNMNTRRIETLDQSICYDHLVIDDFICISGKNTTVDVILENSIDYVALQADVIVPEGMKIVEVEAGPRGDANHTLIKKRIDDHTVRVVLFDLNNSVFAKINEPILRITVTGDNAKSEDIVINNILASDSSANEYVLMSLGGHNSETTGSCVTENNSIRIESGAEGVTIFNAEGKEVSINTLEGMCVATFIAKDNQLIHKLDKGVYIISAGNYAAKIMIK